MGAHNSIPQTIRFENPQQNLEIQITPSVVSRLVTREEKALKNSNCEQCIEFQKQEKEQQQFPCEKIQQAPYNWTQSLDVFQKKYNELEEYQFAKSVERIETLIGKPLARIDDVNETIIILRQDLIKCYKEHPREMLNCAEAAKHYQDFIQREQLKCILNTNRHKKEMPLTESQNQ